ncbi:class I SAM-dependent methyltransferase [Jongsikchunia kroppenstedtii]|uniref:class I SAM-dependent methyltransferase n=1 Tax=Jongsikchunia kroppenstedtii TaxID=1121721 RepID=UPI0003651B04|nr:class I SAM-dependent methyltransferase [Jongsikchunia kroppenstedtii]
MGWYEDQVLPRIIEKTCGMEAMNKLRVAACEPLTGSVIEIGFGSGFNAPLYPDGVTSVTAIEPSDVAWQRAATRVSAAAAPITRAGLDGQRLDFPDNTFDSALSTFTLCTIPDLPAALAELRRVVNPGGTFAFFEHGSAPDAKVQRWQRRLEPIQKRVGGGCHLTRNVREVVTAAGWEIVGADSFYAKGPKTLGAFTMGYARNP